MHSAPPLKTKLCLSDLMTLVIFDFQIWNFVVQFDLSNLFDQLVYNDPRKFDINSFSSERDLSGPSSINNYNSNLEFTSQTRFSSSPDIFPFDYNHGGFLKGRSLAESSEETDLLLHKFMRSTRRAWPYTIAPYLYFPAGFIPFTTTELGDAYDTMVVWILNRVQSPLLCSKHSTIVTIWHRSLLFWLCDPLSFRIQLPGLIPLKKFAQWMCSSIHVLKNLVSSLILRIPQNPYLSTFLESLNIHCCLAVRI